MTSLLEIFFSPGKVFQQVRERSMFLPAFLGVMIMATCSAAVVINLIGMENIVRKQIESNPKAAEQLGPDGIEKRVQMANTPAIKAVGFVAPLLSTAILLLCVSGIFLGVLSVLGAKVNYLQALGATSYAWFPFMVLGFVMTTIILLVTPDRNELDLRNMVATNIGAFLDKQTTGKALYSIATSMDIVVFAQIAFIGYGLSKISGLAYAKCVVAVIALWAIFVLGKAGMSGLF